MREEDRRFAGAAQLAALARVMTATAARRAAPILVPLYFGLFLAASVIFGPNAMRPAEVTRAAIASPGVALGLLGAWLLVAAPAARAVIELPSTFLLRSMPVPRWQFLVVSGAHLAAIELPWIALWGRGEGLIMAMAAGAIAVGAHGLMLARPSRPREIGAAVLLLAGGARPGMGPLVAAAALAAPLGVAAAWRRAPERTTRRRGLPVPRSPVAALAVSQLIAIRRIEGATLGRGLLLATLGGLAAPLAVRAQDIVAPASASALSLGIATGTLSIACAGLAGAALRAEQAQGWLLDATGAGGALRVAAASGATAACGAALGLLHGALASVGLGAGPALAARLAGLGTVLGVALGVHAAWQARRAAADGARRGGRDLARRAGTLGLSITCLATIGEPAVALIVVAALIFALSSARGAAALPEPRCAHGAPGGGAR